MYKRQGYGSCVKACQFGAIEVIDGVAVVDKEKCVACGACVKACPKGLIELVPYEAKHLVQCSSHDKGKEMCIRDRDRRADGGWRKTGPKARKGDWFSGTGFCSKKI